MFFKAKNLTQNQGMNLLKLVTIKTCNLMIFLMKKIILLTQLIINNQSHQQISTYKVIIVEIYPGIYQ